jgi:hypothetical protein
VVSVVNYAPTGTRVDVEFFDLSGVSMGVATDPSLTPGTPDVFVTNSDVLITPFLYDHLAFTVNFDGYAQVNSSDPRIVVAAMMRCGDKGAALPLTINSIPAYPVGATAEFFQAGMPMNWTPPLAEPELPE